MNHREKIQAALNHQQGPIPIDFGSLGVSGMHVSCVAALREHYGLEPRPVKVIEPYQMLGEIDSDLAEVLGIDTIGIVGRTNLFGFANADYKAFRTPWGQDVLVPGDFKTTEAPGGGLHIYPQGDTTVPPSGHMPEGGYFFDTIIRQEPIDEDNLNVEDNLEEFTPVDEEELAYLAEQAVAARATGKAVLAGMPCTAFGDIALVPAPFLKHPKGIRDVTEWYMSTAIRQDYIHELFGRQCDIALANLPKIYDAVGDNIDVAFICGADFGTQTSSFCAPATFEELWLPYYKRVNDWIHANTNWKTFKHSCGAVEPFMSKFIDAGFDIINPVQCSATGMDPNLLKQRYGDRLVFWGGGVDTQKTLPFGTADEVRAEVLQRCEIFSSDGGFVFDAIHNVQAQTPTANIVAMIEAVHEFNGRS